MKIKKIQPALLIFLLLAATSLSLFVFIQKTLSSNTVYFLDSDKDGLSDDEEKALGTDPRKSDTDGDGYSDGVEVNSGYDPLKPAPGDKLIVAKLPATETVAGVESDSESLTSKVSAKVADYIKENGAKEGNLGMEDLDTIIQETIGEDVAEETLPEVDEKAVKILEQNYTNLPEAERKAKEKQDAVNYLTSLAYIAVNNSPEKIGSSSDLEGFSEKIMGKASALIDGSVGMDYFDDLAERGALTLSQMKEIEVPESLVPLHLQGLQLAQYSLELKGKINVDPNDPMAMMVNLSKVQSLLEKSYAYYQDVLVELKKYGIDVGETDSVSE